MQKKPPIKFVFATNNPHKLREIKEIINSDFEVLTLADIGCNEEIPETNPTIKANALQKARFVYEKYGYNCFADDTGLEVAALNGAPGVYSARYAGEGKSFDDNINKLLQELQGINDRAAQFKTVMALIIDGKEYTFEGIVKGTILSKRNGDSGFGYDPVFLPNNFNETFAQMSAEQKNKISHRGRAIDKMLNFLREYNYKQFGS